MVNTLSLVELHQHLSESTKWINALNRGENAAVIFFPKTDRSRRISQLLFDHKRLKKVFQKSTYVFQILDFDPIPIEDIADVADLVAAQLNFGHLADHQMTFNEWFTYMKKNNIILIIVLPQAEKYLTPEGKNAMTHITYFILNHSPFIRVLSVYETDFTNPSLLPFIPTDTHLYENIFYYPLYDNKDLYTFFSYMEKKWTMKIPGEIKNKIISNCGGHLWFVKEMIREYAKEKKINLDNDGIQFRLEAFYKSLLPSEQSTLTKIVRGLNDFTPIEKHCINFFKKMNFLDSRNQCQIKLYNKYLLTQFESASTIKVTGNEVELNQISIDRLFSRKESRVIKYLIQNPDRLIPREEIAKCIWPMNTQEKYSDWAIDQIIARVRKRMKQLALPTDMIRTLRGKGFIYKQ